MKLSEILNKTLSILKDHLSGLLRETGIYILIAIALDAALQFSTQSFNSAVLLFSVFSAEMVLSALITFVGIRYFLESEDIPLDINKTKVLSYFVAAIFISIATVLGFMVLVIPGIIVASVSILYPIYILKEGEGPLSSIEKSIDAIKGNTLIVCLAVCAFYLFVYVISFSVAYILDLIPVHALVEGALINASSYILNLVFIPLIIVIYDSVVLFHANQVPGSDAVESPPRT